MPRSIRENVRVGKPFILIRYPLIKGTSRLNMASTIDFSNGVFTLGYKNIYLANLEVNMKSLVVHMSNKFTVTKDLPIVLF